MSRFTKAELDALRLACSSANGQVLVGRSSIVPAISRTMANRFESLGFVERVNESWVNVTDQARAELEWADELRLAKWCEKNRRTK